ncbi:MAG: glycosyltransferase family 4 protein [Myxococcota bacterium]|nr:glycosyltransferase family 4 protein [Myxococcota bacterium]
MSEARVENGRPLRIAFVSSHPVPYHAPTYRALAARPDVDLEVLFLHHHGVEETFDRQFGRAIKFDVPLLEGFRYRFLKNVSPRPSLFFGGLVNPDLPLAVARGDYDAVVIHGYASVSTLSALIGPRARGTRVLLRSESVLVDHRSPSKRALKQVVLRALFMRIDHFLAIGTQSRDYFRAYGVSPSRISMSPYSVDNQYFADHSAEARSDPAAARSRLGLPIDRPLFLYCSKIIAHKRPLDVLRAFARARRKANAGLVYVGDGPQMAELRAEIARTGLEQDVRVLGFRNQSELPTIYGACDVFVQASEREPWGMVINEAMACGMAICASERVGSAYDLVKDNGAVFPVGDVDRLAELCSAWSSAPDEVDRMKAASRRIIEQWGPGQTAEGVVRGVRAAFGARAEQRR